MINGTEDIITFASIQSARTWNKCGYLTEVHQGFEKVQVYLCLYGNIIFVLSDELDSSSIQRIIFLESATIDKVDSDENKTFSICSVGGIMTTLEANNEQEMDEWVRAVESSTFIAMSRKLDDSIAKSVLLQNRVQQQKVINQSYEKKFFEMSNEVKQVNNEMDELRKQLAKLEKEKFDQSRKLKDTQNERLLLLKSRGVSPKAMPLWAINEMPREGAVQITDRVRIWAGTWNLSCAEPFAGMDKDRAQRLLLPLVPEGYDIYVFGVQECTSDSTFECLDALLLAEGCRRLKMTTTVAKRESFGHDLSEAGSERVSFDASKLRARADGSLFSLKYSAIVVYVRMNLMGDVKLLTSGHYPFVTGGADGAIAVIISVLGRTVALVNCLMSSKDNEVRRDQYQTLISALGGLLGETGFHLNEQFHHILFIGSMNYRLVDKSGNKMPAETAVKMLEDVRLNRTLFDSHDHLNQEKNSRMVFFGFREPTPFPNFFPTCKKIENRLPVNYTTPGWVKQCYSIYSRGSFYKGGKTKESIPGFCDRIFFHSMVNLAEDLLPERVSTEMDVFRKAQTQETDSGDEGDEADKLTVLSRMTVVVDNYQSMNDGEALNASEHSPVTTTFLLRVRHDYEKLLEQSLHMKSTGDIKYVFTALSSADGTEESNPELTPQVTPTREKLTVPAFSALDDSLMNSTESSNKESISGKEENESTKISNLGKELAKVGIQKIYKYSLLPPGTYKIRVTNMRLIFGSSEEVPSLVSILFPAPYEASAGERFADFRTDFDSSEQDGKSGQEPYTLSCLSTSFDERDVIAGSQSAPATSTISSPFGTPDRRAVKFNTPTRGPIRSTITNNTNNRASLQRGRNNAGSRESLFSPTDAQWTRKASKTGTCMVLEACKSETLGQVPPLLLTWKGQEPLDTLHLSFKVTSAAASVSSTVAPSRVGSGRFSSFRFTENSTVAGASMAGSATTDPEEVVVGHSAVALEQLCQVAVASSGGVCGKTSTARILLDQGRPMYNIDSKTMQREMVTFCCDLELIPS